ncbi:MAG: hypothetical protein IJI11_00050 [Mogibacterium sp.]|nr:hypothetical protein [Mogibacterium sp.]
MAQEVPACCLHYIFCQLCSISLKPAPVLGAINAFITGVEVKVSDVVIKVEKLDLETCKNFLVRCLADFEKGVVLSAVEKQRFWEEYEHYIKNGGNTYIKEWTEKLKKEDRI